MKVILMISLFICANISWADEVTIYIRDDVYNDYIRFVDNRDVLSITNFTGANIRRDVVDMIIAQQALALGGFSHSFNYIPGKVNYRNTKMLLEGNLLISFDSYWLSDAKNMSNSVYISDPVIRKGEYIAGIYTNPANTKVLAIRQLNDLTTLTAVSTPLWHTDWATLSALPLKKLIREDEWLSMARMVDLKWIDFILMPFNSTPDQSFTLEKIFLVPVPNIGIELSDSRHFVISKKHKLGEEASLALNRGLSILRSSNSIVKAYTQAGFFINKDNLIILNKTSSTSTVY